MWFVFISRKAMIICGDAHSCSLVPTTKAGSITCTSDTSTCMYYYYNPFVSEVGTVYTVLLDNLYTCIHPIASLFLRVEDHVQYYDVSALPENYVHAL